MGRSGPDRWMVLEMAVPHGCSTRPVDALKSLRFALTMAAWAVGLVLCAATTRPFATVELGAALLLAALAGFLWSRGSGVALRASRAMAWVNALGGLLWAMAFAPGLFAGAWLAGACTFGLIYTLERAFLGKRGRPA